LLEVQSENDNHYHFDTETGPSQGGSNGRSYEGLIFSPLTAAAGPWLMSPRGRQGLSVETQRAATVFAATNRP